MFQTSELSSEARRWLTSKEALTATKNVQAKGLRFYVAPLKVAPLAEFVVTELDFNIKRMAYGGTFSDLVYPSHFLPGQTFPEGGLIRGRYTNTSNVPLAIRIRVIDATKIVAEEQVVSTRPPGTTWDFWLPVAGVIVKMPDVAQWNMTLQMLGYY